eukprot:SAG11_NODE_111_length_16190_cov_9.912808_3_plen_167_part_00
MARVQPIFGCCTWVVAGGKAELDALWLVELQTSDGSLIGRAVGSQRSGEGAGGITHLPLRMKGASAAWWQLAGGNACSIEADREPDAIATAAPRSHAPQPAAEGGLAPPPPEATAATDRPLPTVELARFNITAPALCRLLDTASVPRCQAVQSQFSQIGPLARTAW